MSLAATTTSIRSGTFWAELKPREHLLQCWSHEDSLIDALEGFVSAGLRGGEGVVVIATATHLHLMEKRMRAHWIDVDRARWENRYLPLLAQETLERLLDADRMPDDARVDAFATELLERASAGSRRVRFCGEMVGLLWAQGNVAAAIQLENLWSRFIDRQGAVLLCAYDRKLFDGQPASAMKGVCALHTVTLPG